MTMPRGIKEVTLSQEMLKAALEYVALGWPVFPTRHDKTPYTANGVLDATTDPEQIERWWSKWPGANIALNCGEANLLVVDFDPGADIPERVFEKYHVKATGLVAATPRGGEHHYYLLDEGDDPVPNSSGRIAEHVDIRSFNGYVLLPPSTTADGAYTWSSRKRAARRSDELFAAAGKRRDKDSQHDTWHIEPDLPENVSLARSWLRGDQAIGSSWCKPAIEGAGGDNTTYATAAMMKSCGLSEGTALELMWEVYNERCQPPWEYDDLAVKVQNGYGYNTSPPGNVTPAYHVARVSGLFKPTKEETLGDGGLQVTSGRFRFVDRAGLEAVSPPDWLLPDTLPEESFALLIGRAGSYKTFLALDMALTVATGGGALRAGEWRGMWESPRRPGPVLYVAGEGRSGLRQRVEAWEALHLDGERARDFVLADPVPHIQEGGLEKFIEGATAMYRDYALIVLDTVSRAMQGTNENAQENATGFTRMADTLRRELGGTVLGLHHSGHDNEERGRGSSAFEADADTVLVALGRAQRLAEVRMTKQKDWEAWGQSRWAAMEEVDLGGGRGSLASTVAEPPPAEKRAAMEGRITLATVDRFVVDFLSQHPMQEFTLAELARRVAHHEMRVEGSEPATLGVSESTLRRDGATGLKTLRAPGSGALSQPMYDVAKDRWRYSAPAASSFSPV